MSEVGTEHPDVIASAVTRTNYRLGCQLISDTEARRKCGEFVIDIPIQPVRAKASDPDPAETAVIDDIGKATVALRVYRLREIDLPAQSIVDGQLGRHTP